MVLPRILITGSSGFIGTLLLRTLPSSGFEAVAAKLELEDGASFDRALSGPPCDGIVHLAAISHVPTCEGNPAKAYGLNLGGTALLLDAIQKHQPQAHLFFASTAQVYAAPNAEEVSKGVVFEESREIAPQNTYARTKWACELLIQDAAARRGLRATILRLFNHTHKSQSPDFFLPHIYQALQAGSAKIIPVGNLNLRRDIGSARDLAAAWSAVLRKGLHQGPTPVGSSAAVFNVCSGTPYQLQRLAERLAAQLGKSVSFVVDPARVRPNEAVSIVGSHEKLTAATGWKPTCKNENDLITEFLADVL